MCLSRLQVQSDQPKPSQSSLQPAKSTALKSYAGLTNTDLYAIARLAFLETYI